MYFFRKFKKSTAPYKVHYMGFRYIKIKRARNTRTPFLNLTHSLISSKKFLMYFLQACLLTIPGSHIPFPTPSGSLLVFKVHVQRFTKFII